MNMLDMLEKELYSRGAFSGELPEIVKAVADSIPTTTLPYRMKTAIAVSELMLYASQFRINIRHWNDSMIPVNAITFCIAKSGAAKDSSLRNARKCFQSSYEKINEYRADFARIHAKEAAKEAGKRNPNEFSTYKDFLVPPNPLFVAVSTPEGFLQHLNDLAENPMGAGYIYSGEFGQELESNANMVEMCKIISELYDEGTKEVKILKDRERQGKEIKNLPVSALFISSPDHLLFDESIKRKFKDQFTTKLARRSFFIFANDQEEALDYNSVDELLAAQTAMEDKAKESRERLSTFIDSLTVDLVSCPFSCLTVSKEARELCTLYKQYCEEMAKPMNSMFPIAKLCRQHMYWKAFKLAGALALLEYSPTILQEHYIQAVSYVELISEDIGLFEKELVKEPYELFTSYCKMYSLDGRYSMSLHNLRKHGFISLKGSSTTQMKELVKLANSFDKDGAYTVKGDEVFYEELQKPLYLTVSYVEASGTKQQRATKVAMGYQSEEVEFKDLKNLLQGDFAYSNFVFSNGVRSKENIEGGTKWLVLDIDDSEIVDTEAHLLLGDIRHFICRTSNPDNESKYRVLLELSCVIDVPDIQWRLFLELVSNELGLNCDLLPKSQIFFSYAKSASTLLENLEAEPFDVKPVLDLLAAQPVAPKKAPTKSSCNKMLENPLSTFEQAFQAKDGEGSRKLVWAVKYARELGADLNYALDLVHQISSYWVKPFPEDRLLALERQISRWNWQE